MTTRSFFFQVFFFQMNKFVILHDDRLIEETVSTLGSQIGKFQNCLSGML